MKHERAPLMEQPASGAMFAALIPEDSGTQPAAAHRFSASPIYALLVVASFALGLLIGWQAFGRRPAAPALGVAQDITVPTLPAKDTAGAALAAAFLDEVNPPQGYTLPVAYGALGPALLQSGAIDFDKFAGIYSQAGTPLTQAEIGVLKNGSDEPIVINADNARFVLNFFWAVGLANRNSILTDGPITQYSKGNIDSFASTGGWTLAARPVKDVFASQDLITLSPEQQARVEEAAAAIYRPCCDNATLFPDCNHGMAMLGLLELMGSQDASVGQMLAAAKYVNAYWFPQQAVEIAIFLKAAQNVDFSAADPRMVVGAQLSSASGAGQLHSQLKANGLLPASPENGGGCGA
ncbi:MAG: hypothetical protein ACM3MF_09260 [Anaerolineae bacterium]